MLQRIDLRALAEKTGPERAFLSLYISDKDGLKRLDWRIQTVERLLASHPAELEYFQENLKMVRAFLQEQNINSDSVAIFACWATDYIEAYPLKRGVDELLWVDSSPYIRPLAELQDEFETFVLVTADNEGSSIYLVTAEAARVKERVKGDVKNRVKVGGWSQKRYQRRRTKELKQYAKEVGEVLQEISKKHSFERIAIIGSDEAVQEIKQNLPDELAEMVAGTDSAQLKDEDGVFSRAFELIENDFREEEQALWQTIENEYMRGERAEVGPGKVLEAAAVGRVERLLVTEGVKIPGTRCRDCENLFAGELKSCKICGSKSVFSVELVNELVELMALSSGKVEFAEPLEGLEKVGHVAALLRY